MPQVCELLVDASALSQLADLECSSSVARAVVDLRFPGRRVTMGFTKSRSVWTIASWRSFPDMSVQTFQIELPGSLLARAHVHRPDEARELVTFLLEGYAQEMEKAQRQQVYEAYYAARTPEEETEELQILADFSVVDAEIVDEATL